jgi:HK97 family phage portal protein
MRSPLGTLINRLAATPAPPVPFVGRRGGATLMAPSRADRASQLAAMGSVGTLFAIVNRTSNATSQVEWKLWRKARSGKKEDRQEVTSHAALDLWVKPNAFMPCQEFVETFQQHVDLVGEAWWVIARHRASRLPLELWPVRPDRMAPVPDPNTFIRGYVYTSPDGEQVPLQRDEVIQLRMPNPEDLYRGMGPVQSILADLDATRYSAEWNRNFFHNSSEPGGIIEVDRRLDDDEFDELTARWREQHQGVSRAHRVAVIESGMKWVDRAFSQRDMQFAELRSVSSAVIREAFGIPKFAVGDVDDVNRATADASATWFAQYLTTPRLQRIKAALNFELLPLFGPSVSSLEFDYEDPVPANQEAANARLSTQANAAKTLVDAGFDPAGVLEVVGLPEIEHTPKPAPQPPRPPVSPAESDEDEEPEGDGPANRLFLGTEIEAAMRWRVEAHLDDNTCDECRKNHGKLYRNREDAWKDYPGGSGYVNCVGAKYGNKCRCKVVKRRGGKND